MSLNCFPFLFSASPCSRLPPLWCFNASMRCILPLLQFYWKYFGVEPINGPLKNQFWRSEKPHSIRTNVDWPNNNSAHDVQWTLFLCRILVPFERGQLMRIIQRKRMFLPNPICRRLCFACTMHVPTWRKTNDAATVQRTLCGVVLHCQWSRVIDFIVVIVYCSALLAFRHIQYEYRTLCSLSLSALDRWRSNAFVMYGAFPLIHKNVQWLMINVALCYIIITPMRRYIPI